MEHINTILSTLQLNNFTNKKYYNDSKIRRDFEKAKKEGHVITRKSN